MDNIKHTPGPWTVSRESETALTIVAPWSDKIQPGRVDGWGDYRGIHTATITHHAADGAVPREHAEANARLIAAAPELLEALVGLANVFHEGQVFPRNGATGYVEAALANAEAAISKATKDQKQ